ncbi:MAG: hypothetical protein ACK5LS_01120 [Propioniciclava sp.]
MASPPSETLTFQRDVTPAEVDAIQIAGLRAIAPLVGGAAGLAYLIALGIMARVVGIGQELAWFAIAVPIVLAILLAITVPVTLTRARARHRATGTPTTVTASWNPRGFQLRTRGVDVAADWREVRRMRTIGEITVIRLPLVSPGTSRPAFVSVVSSLVPPAAWQWWRQSR